MTSWGLAVVKPDVIVVGGGPAGSSAAWYAARRGARVLLCDKAKFPRDKPCGDGVTPRGVALLAQMGLGDSLDRFHRFDRLRILGAGRVLEGAFPQRPGLPPHGYVVPRTELDELILRHAEAAGARVYEGTEVLGPLIEKGVVRGVRARRGGRESEILGDVIIAADGASAPLGRQLGMLPIQDRPLAVAVRAQVETSRPEDSALEGYLEVRDGKALLPGYAWVFPMGEGRMNVGLGILSTTSRWKEVNTARLLDAFVKSLPQSWGIASVSELRKTGQLKGWRVPMGLRIWPPWRPGLLAVGDAAGVVKPHTGAGISKAIHSGLIGAEAAVQALGEGDPADLSDYAHRIEKLWGSYYQQANSFLKFFGHPTMWHALVIVTMWFWPFRWRIQRAVLGSKEDIPEPFPPFQFHQIQSLSSQSVRQ